MSSPRRGPSHGAQRIAALIDHLLLFGDSTDARQPHGGRVGDVVQRLGHRRGYAEQQLIVLSAITDVRLNRLIHELGDAPHPGIDREQAAVELSAAARPRRGGVGRGPGRR